jgi:predicted HAD superfamily Cof-like phosphohydrolase
MKDKFKKVAKFNRSFNNELKYSPSLIPLKSGILQHELMKEENDEYLDAIMDNNIIGVADALGDQLYILLGTILKHGMQYVISDVFDEIHRSNMSKIPVEGKAVYREDGKILKPSTYSKPNLKPIVCQ